MVLHGDISRKVYHMLRKPKMRHIEYLCEWCFCSVPKGRKIFCTDYCIEQAKEWNERANSLQRWQHQARHDLTKHLLDMLFGE